MIPATNHVLHHWAAMSAVSTAASSCAWFLIRLCCHRQVYRGMLDAARGVAAQQGPLGLYSGLSVTLLEIVPYAALQFGLYDLFTAAAGRARTKVGWVP